MTGRLCGRNRSYVHGMVIRHRRFNHVLVTSVYLMTHTHTQHTFVLFNTHSIQFCVFPSLRDTTHSFACFTLLFSQGPARLLKATELLTARLSVRQLMPARALRTGLQAALEHEQWCVRAGVR